MSKVVSAIGILFALVLGSAQAQSNLLLMGVGGTPSGGGGGGPVLVHPWVSSCNTSAATTLAQTITATTSGNILAVLSYNEGNSATAPTIAAAGVTFVTQEADVNFDTHRSIMLFSAVSIPSSVTTVTMTWPVSTTGCVAVAEYSGLTAVDASCGGAVCYTNEATPFTGASLTPTSGKNELLVGEVFDPSGPNNTATFAGTGGWSVATTAYENAGSYGSFAVYSQIVASTSGSYAITGTNSGASAGQDITKPMTFEP